MAHFLENAAADTIGPMELTKRYMYLMSKHDMRFTCIGDCVARRCLERINARLGLDLNIRLARRAKPSSVWRVWADTLYMFSGESYCIYTPIDFTDCAFAGLSLNDKVPTDEAAMDFLSTFVRWTGERRVFADYAVRLSMDDWRFDLAPHLSTPLPRIPEFTSYGHLTYLLDTMDA